MVYPVVGKNRFSGSEISIKLSVGNGKVIDYPGTGLYNYLFIFLSKQAAVYKEN